MPVPGAPHEAVALPSASYGARRNPAGLDLSDEAVLTSLGEALVDSAQRKWTAGASAGDARPVRNPADQRDIVGHVTEVSEAAANDAMGRIANGSGEIGRAHV